MYVTWHLDEKTVMTTRYNVHRHIDQSYVTFINKEDEFTVHAPIEQLERMASLLFFAAQELRLLRLQKIAKGKPAAEESDEELLAAHTPKIGGVS